MSTERLTPTSYLVLGLLAREGPSTPYDLEQHVKATLGNFWSFPHTLLYSEPPRLGALGLVTETRETEGRRRRVFAITPAGTSALGAWLDRPSDAPTELAIQGFFSSSSRTWRPMMRNVDSPSGNSRSTRRSSPPTVRPIATNGARMDLSGASGRSSTGAARPCRWVCGTRALRSISGPTSSRKPARPQRRSPAATDAWWPPALQARTPVPRSY